MRKKVAVSGGFDPIHSGHIRMFREACRLGDLYVILNSDRFLVEKKGKAFLDFEERKEILESIKYIHAVIPCIDEDMTVQETLRSLKPDFFANGGDRKAENTPEGAVCDELGIEMVWNVGGEKIQSSSDLLKKYAT